jgi:hypothetical protein
LKGLKQVNQFVFFPEQHLTAGKYFPAVIIKIIKMEPQTNLIEPLLEKAEAYGKTSFELLKLKTLAKTADVSSSIFSRSLFILVISFFAFTLNTAVALWIGDLLGKIYYGFFIVAGFYALVSVILLMVHPFVKTRINNTIIKQLFN